MARARRRDFSAMHPTVKPVAMVVDAIPFTTPGKWELFRQPIPERCRAELRSPRSVTCQARFTKGLRIIGAAPMRVLPPWTTERTGEPKAAVTRYVCTPTYDDVPVAKS